MAINNAANLKATGIITHDGAGTFTGSTVTEGAVLLGSTSNTITDTGVLSKGTLIVGDGATAPTLLGVGTNNYILVADSAQGSGVKWADPSTGAVVLKYLSSVTASSSTTVDFTSNINSTYANYLITITDLIPGSDGFFLALRTSTNAGSSWDSAASDYMWSIYYIDTTTAENSSTADSWIQLTSSAADELGNGTGETCSAWIWIYNPSSAATNTRIYWDITYVGDRGYCNRTIGAGERVAAADVDGIRFIMESGNIASGVFRLYGVANS